MYLLDLVQCAISHLIMSVLLYQHRNITSDGQTNGICLLLKQKCSVAIVKMLQKIDSFIFRKQSNHRISQATLYCLIQAAWTRRGSWSDLGKLYCVVVGSLGLCSVWVKLHNKPLFHIRILNITLMCPEG